MTATNISGLANLLMTGKVDPRIMQQETCVEWFPAETLSDVMERPARCFIRAEGYTEHSGSRWARVWCDLVHTNADTGWGFRRADMDRMMRDGDMSVIER